jgi:hypothetical protein
MLDKEQKKEGNIIFTRYYCKEGYIDVYTGDVANNPNHSIPTNMKLNSVRTYYRCNESNWLTSFHLINFSKIMEFLEIREYFTADDIWMQLLR